MFSFPSVLFSKTLRLCGGGVDCTVLCVSVEVCPLRARAGCIFRLSFEYFQLEKIIFEKDFFKSSILG